MKNYLLTFLLLHSCFLIFSQNMLDKQQEFHTLIDQIYDFRPKKLSKEEHQVVIKELDSLFSKVEKDTTTYLPLLRNELKTNGHLPYFYFDCGHLLIIHSNSKSDLQLCADAFLKCDITEVGPQSYVQLTALLAKQKINTTEVAMKMLEDTNFTFYLPNHFFRFSKSYCLLYGLHHLNPALYTDSLIAYFKNTKDEGNQRAIITVLWFSYSCKGDDFLKSLTKKTTLNKSVFKYAKKIMTYDKLDDFYEKAYDNLQEGDLEKFKLEALSHFSDEAIWELDFVTKAQRRKGKCN